MKEGVSMQAYKPGQIYFATKLLFLNPASGVNMISVEDFLRWKIHAKK